MIDYSLTCPDCGHISAYHNAYGCARGDCRCRCTPDWIQSIAPPDDAPPALDADVASALNPWS